MFWGKSENDSLVCIKFHEKNQDGNDLVPKNDNIADDNYFTVVSKVTGPLKNRSVHDFHYKNNILFSTCKQENRVFVVGFGVTIMTQVRNQP